MNHENSTLLQQDLHLLNNIDDHATYELRNLGVSTEEVTDVDTLNKRVNDFAPEQGWACYQSQLLAFKATTVKPNDNSGLLLNAEYCKGQSNQRQSLHIRHLGRKRWLLTCYQENSNSAETHLCNQRLDEPLLQSGPAQDTKCQKICYRTYWLHDPDHNHELTPTHSVFNGFAGGESK